MFSKACEYALKIMIYLATVQGDKNWVGLKVIATAINSPESFTAKILQQLVRKDLLLSLRGPSGGFQIRKGQTITFLEIIEAMDGEGILKDCVLGLEMCSNTRPCPVHDKFVAIREHLTGILTTTSISEIKDGVIEGNRFLKL